jgi:TRAP-type C4-dicarboxylate transport system permease small subunit
VLLKKGTKIVQSVENWIAVGSILLLAFLPVAEIIARKVFKGGITASTLYVYHLVLLVTFLGGTITSREKRHLSLAVGSDLLKGEVKT